VNVNYMYGNGMLSKRLTSYCEESWMIRLLLTGLVLEDEGWDQLVDTDIVYGKIREE
jgi:hypothetical protein